MRRRHLDDRDCERRETHDADPGFGRRAVQPRQYSEHSRPRQFQGRQLPFVGLEARLSAGRQERRRHRLRRERRAVHPEDRAGGRYAEVVPALAAIRDAEKNLPRHQRLGCNGCRSAAWLRPLARLKVYLAFEKFILRRRLNPDARLKGEAAFRALLEKKVKDPELRRKLTPNYPMGCKRQLVSDVWYEALTRPNVEVVDTPIERIDAEGLVTQDGKHHKVDAIIYGTGFTPTSFLTPMKIHGSRAAISTRRGATAPKPISASP